MMGERPRTGSHFMKFSNETAQKIQPPKLTPAFVCCCLVGLHIMNEKPSENRKQLQNSPGSPVTIVLKHSKQRQGT